MATLVLKESYQTGHDGSLRVPRNYGGGGVVVFLAQTFTAESSYSIGMVRLRLFRYLLPGTITVSIYATDGSGFPTGSALCTGTTDGDTLTDNSSGELRDIYFNTTAEITDTIKYGITITAPSGDANNTIAWRYDLSASYTGGQALLFDYLSSGVWNDAGNPDRDFMFSTYLVIEDRQVENPTPSDTDIDIVLTPLLQWEVSGEGLKEGDSFDVYLKAGDSNFGSEDLLRNVTDLDVQIIGGLSYNTLYYWQAVPFSEEGDLLGADAWSFTTILFLPPAVSVDGSGNPTGLNNMVTLKRIVVAANNKIFFET